MSEFDVKTIRKRFWLSSLPELWSWSRSPLPPFSGKDSDYRHHLHKNTGEDEPDLQLHHRHCYHHRRRKNLKLVTDTRSANEILGSENEVLRSENHHLLELVFAKKEDLLGGEELVIRGGDRRPTHSIWFFLLEGVRLKILHQIWFRVCGEEGDGGG